MIAGRYTLEREIGRGGMGAVWLGRDEVLGRAVALKRIGLMPGSSGPDLARAEREARLAARLSNAHVVAVFDLVHEDDQQWLVMEYVEGTTFAELIKANGALPPDEVAPILLQAADGLAAAHAAGIVHRDVKPSNILVTPDGQVKLSDFGIARAEADPSLTQTGLVTGSPAYLAPEVAAGHTATDASDVWSLGATLYHALAGRPPYDVGDNLLGALYRIVHEEPPRLEDGGWLAELQHHCMTRDPADRWTMGRVRSFLVHGPGPDAGRRRTAAPPPPVDRTQVLAPTPEPAPEPTPTPTSTPAPTPVPAPAAAPAAAATPAPAREGGNGRGWLPLLVGVAVVALAVVVILALTLGGEDGSTPTTSGTSDTPSSSAPEESESADPSAEEMESFIRDYLDTAASEPEQAFALLTPAFQRESGGLDGYVDGFWGNVRRVDSVSGVDADPEALTIDYTYRYTLRNGQTRSEDISLQLEFSDGEYLIAGPA